MRRLLTLTAISLILQSASGVFAADATGLFNKECAACHGKDGKARTPIGKKLGAKDLAEIKISEAEIEKQIAEGKKGDNGGFLMPSFKAKLSPEQIKSLVALVKKFRE